MNDAVAFEIKERYVQKVDKNIDSICDFKYDISSVVKNKTVRIVATLINNMYYASDVYITHYANVIYLINPKKMLIVANKLNPEKYKIILKNTEMIFIDKASELSKSIDLLRLNIYKTNCTVDVTLNDVNTDRYVQILDYDKSIVQIDYKIIMSMCFIGYDVLRYCNDLEGYFNTLYLKSKNEGLKIKNIYCNRYKRYDDAKFENLYYLAELYYMLTAYNCDSAHYNYNLEKLSKNININALNLIFAKVENKKELMTDIHRILTNTNKRVSNLYKYPVFQGRLR